VINKGEDSRSEQFREQLILEYLDRDEEAKILREMQEDKILQKRRKSSEKVGKKA
jgi:hypothetical protein